MLYEQVLADLFEAEIVAVHDADEIDETEENPVYLAREAASPILEQYEDTPLFVFETDHGFLVGGGSHGILMIPDGSVEVQEIPEDDEDDEDLGEAQGRAMSAGDKKAIQMILMRHGLGETLDYVKEIAEELDDDDFEDIEIDEDAEYEYTLDMVQEHVAGYIDEYHEGEITQELLELLRAFDEAKSDEDYYRAIAAMESIADFVGTPLDEAGYFGGGPMPKLPMDTGPGYEGRSVSAGPKGDAPTAKTYGKGNVSGQTTLNKYMSGLYGAKHSTDGKEAGPAPKKPKDVGGAYAARESVDDAYGGPYDGPQQPQLAHPKTKKEKKNRKGVNSESDETMFEFTFPQGRVKEFLALASKAGADTDCAVTVEDGNVSVTLPEDVAKKTRVQFGGDDVTITKLETVEAED